MSRRFAEPRRREPVSADAGTGYRAAQAANYATQVRVVNGRAFYQNGTIWTDATAQAEKGLKNREIRFASADYFALIERQPAVAAWLALGNEIDVVVDGTLYQVRN